MSYLFRACLLGLCLATVLGGGVHAAPVTITFSYWGSADENAIWTEVIDAFMAEHLDIKVEQTSMQTYVWEPK
jgi:ABC-type glycerol-3-phosphate transport system substrate-binding protein